MSCQEVDLRWTPSTGTVSGYNVYRKLTTDASYTMLTQLGATPAFPVRDTTASGSSMYSYGVAAFNQGGNSPMATALVNTPTCPVTNGSLRWATRMGGASADSGNAVAVRASNGNVVVAGRLYGTGDFGGVTLTSAGNTDMFIAEYTPAGALVWARRYGGAAGDERVNGLALDPSGNIVAVGSFWGTANFGGGDLVNNSTPDDIFLVKLTATGDHVWSRSLGSWDIDMGNGVAVDSSGDVILAGGFEDTVDFGGMTLTSSGLDTVIAKYAGTSGVLRWAHNFPSTSGDRAVGVVVDKRANCDGSGNATHTDCIIFAGSFYGTINYGGGNFTGGSFSNVSAVKLSSSGSYIWAKQFKGTNEDFGTAVAVDGNGDVLVSGNFGLGTMTVGTTILTSSGLQNGFVFKLSGIDGSPSWGRSVTGIANNVAYGVAADSANNVVLTGGFFGSVTLSGSTLTSAGSSDVFVAKYTASGGLTWARRFGDVNDENGTGVTVDSNGNVAVTGLFRYSTNVLGMPLTSAGSTDAFLVSLTP